MLDLLLDRIDASAFSGRSAIIYDNSVFSCQDLRDRIEYCDELFRKKGISPRKCGHHKV
jgi:hypothetical protein